MATMQDVARHANVSIATVSFTINNTKPVAPATRAKVEAAMRELGFRRNAMGRALASKRTRILALLFPAFEHKFSGTVVKFFTSAAEAARSRGYSLVLWPLNNDSDELVELTSTGLIDGALLMAVELDDARVDHLLASNTPFTLIGRTREPSDLTYVDINFEATLAHAVAYLQELGHSNFCLIDSGVDGNRNTMYGPIARTRATFEAEMTARSLPSVIRSCEENPSAGRSAAHAFTRENLETTAVIIMNEHAASGFVSGLRHAGIGVPDDVSIVSMSTSQDMGMMSDPPLTVMTSPSAELGRMGVEALIDQLEGNAQSVPQTLLECRLEEGESTGPARARRPVA